MKKKEKEKILIYSHLFNFFRKLTNFHTDTDYLLKILQKASYTSNFNGLSRVSTLSSSFLFFKWIVTTEAGVLHDL